MSATAQTIEPLQVLRGLAATLVMIKHTVYEVKMTSPLAFNGDFANFFHVGIDMFFVLSGFIMVYISWGQSGAGAARDFIVRRIIRIVPTYWFYTFVLLGVALIIPQVLAKAEYVPIDFLKSLFFVPYMNTAGDLQPFLANGWTLNYEMYFYAVFALCLFLPPLLGLSALLAYLAVSVWTGFFGLDGDVARVYGSPMVLEFAAGALMGFLYMKNIRLPSWVFPAGVVYIVLMLGALAFYGDVIEAEIGGLLLRMFAGISAVLVIALPRGVENMTMPRWGVFAGDASYSIYLSHSFGIGAVTQLVLLAGLETTLSPWLIFAATVVVCLIGGSLAYVLVEKKLITLGRALTRTTPGRNYRQVERTV